MSRRLVMRSMRWVPVLIVLTACGGAARGTFVLPGDDGGGDAGALDAGASDGPASDGATHDSSASDGGSKDATASDGATDGTVADGTVDGTVDGGDGSQSDTGTNDVTASDGPSADGAGDAQPSDAAAADVLADAPEADGGGADAAVDAAVCSSGQTGCVGSTPETCSGGQWVLTDAACSGGTPVCLAGACVACAPGSAECSGNTAETCDSTGTWGNPVDCTVTNQTCVSGACVGVCAPDQTRCTAGNAVQLCDPTGNWGSVVACFGQTCVGGACVGVCAPGQTQCSGNGVETCDSTGSWGSPVDCGSQTCLDGACGVLVITPAAQTIDVAYGQQSPTVQYAASINGTQVPAAFALDHGQIGSVGSSTGLMTPTGTAGGTANVSATYQNQTVSTPLTVQIQLTQNGDPNAGDAGGGAGGNGGVGGAGPGGSVPPGTVGTLGGTPTADPGLAWLYPYDQTMWPQGLLAPLLQWQPGTAGSTSPYYEAVSVRIVENGLNYQGYFAANATPFVNIPVEQLAWDLMAYSNAGDPVTVSLVFASNGVAYGPLTETWKVAPGLLKGTVYYNSYGTHLATNYCCTKTGQPFGGATLGIKHGAAAPTLVAGWSSYTGGSTSIAGCRVCHSVSADGSTLVTQHGDQYPTSSWYALATLTETTMTPTNTGQYAWPALFPDGSILFTDGAPLSGGGQYAAQLFNTKTFAAVASTGIPSGLKAGSPVFSPDGKHVVFNDTSGDGISLAAMDFDGSTHAFSNFRKIYTPSSTSTTALWPTVMPTNDSVVFELEVQYNGRDWGGTRSPCDSTTCLDENLSGAQGELWWVMLSSPYAAARLDVVDGRRNGTSYLPTSTSHTIDTVLDYEPTVLPVASGGEAWVVFTTRRLYGNVATVPAYWSDPRYVDISAQPTTKKLWVAAIDLEATPGTDPSHPAFYLPGQELLAGNSRGYWVLDPCQADGTTCQSGDECCGGYCESVDGGLVCSSTPPACSQVGDKCTQTSDCCGANLGIQCIGGYCAQPTQ